MQSGAYQNGTFVVGVAKGGVEEGVPSLCDSRIIAPSGEILAAAQTEGDELIVADCDLDWCKQYTGTLFDSTATGGRGLHASHDAAWRAPDGESLTDYFSRPGGTGQPDFEIEARRRGRVVSSRGRLHAATTINQPAGAGARSPDWRRSARSGSSSPLRW